MSSDIARPVDETPSLLPAGVAEFLSFFRTELAGVAFPDLDRDRFEGLEAAVRTAERQLSTAQAEVERARCALAQSVSILEQEARRGIAYARIYAETKPELLDRLAGLQLGQGGRRVKKAPPRRKGALRVATTTDGEAQAR